MVVPSYGFAFFEHKERIVMSGHVFSRAVLFLAVALCATVARAVNIPTNQGSGQDGFVYSGAPVAPSNLFPVLSMGKTQSAAHDTESLVQFDLTGVTLAEATSATLNLFVKDTAATGFGSNPSDAFPVIIDLFPVTASWVRSTVQWTGKPGAGSLISSTTLDTDDNGVWVSIDVTSQVQSWISNPATNFGFWLKAQAISGGPGNYHYAAFGSGFGSQTEAPPYLSIVPEPSSFVLAGLMVPALVWTMVRTRRRKVSG
jgi:hypothetical protein